MKRKGSILGIILFTCVMLTGCTNYIKEGTELLEANDYAQAENLFLEAVEKGRKLDQAYQGLGICYWETNQYEKSVDAFENSLKEGGEESAVIYNLMGLASLMDQKPEDAILYLQQGLQLEEAAEELKMEMSYNLISAYEEAGKFVEAKESLKEYIEKYPDDERAVKELEFLTTQINE